MPSLLVACRLFCAPPLRTQPAWRLCQSANRIAALNYICVRAMASAGPSGGAAAFAAAAAAATAHLVWFRAGDLRLADHEPLHTAASCLQIQSAKGSQADGQPEPLLLPFFCLDERQLAAALHSLLGLPQLGPHRLRCAAACFAVWNLCTAEGCAAQAGGTLSWHGFPCF